MKSILKPIIDDSITLDRNFQITETIGSINTEDNPIISSARLVDFDDLSANNSKIILRKINKREISIEDFSHDQLINVKINTILIS